jgi:ribose/xylose/arabinose/galactoside ABC-type transport system permease subunit
MNRSLPRNNQASNAISFKDIILKYNTLVVLLIIFLVFAFASDSFLKTTNLINVIRQVSINGIIAMGMTLVILTGGIELSVGAVVALASVIAATVANEANVVWWLSIPIAIGIAAFVGLITGVFISFFNLAPFIMTLAMMTIARGLAYTFSDGKPVSGVHTEFLVIGKGDLLGIPIPAWILLLVVVATFILLRYIPLGRYIYAIGGNERAARVSGLNIRKIKVLVYVIAGFFTGIASVVLTSRLSAGLPQVASGAEMDAIAAVVIGGTSLAGGKGGMLGTLIGVLIIGFINNGMDLLNVASYPQQIIKGVIIILAVLLDSIKNKTE